MTTGSLVNLIYANSAEPVPAVGMGATILRWTDRAAATIVEVSPSGKSLKVKGDRSIRTDDNGMSDAQSYRYEPIEDIRPITYTLRKNGRWVRQGDPMNGESLAIGIRDTYHDYSF